RCVPDGCTPGRAGAGSRLSEGDRRSGGGGSKQPRIRLRRKEYSLLHRSVMERDGWRCQGCGSCVRLEVHHITPKSQLGHDAEEISLCCAATATGAYMKNKAAGPACGG